jgi:SAM-dependent methyltransferase
MHYLNPQPTIKDLARYYPPEYAPFTTTAPDKLPLFKRLSVNYGLRKRCQAIQQYKRGGRLLEIGCANGLFLDAMRRTGNWQVQGVETSKTAARHAQEQLALDIWNGSLQEAQFPEDRFDAIAMWDVLEHVHDPQETLLEIQRVLKPDGALVLRLPLLDSWDRRLFGRYWVGWDAPRHLSTFSLSTLKQMLEQTGFRLERASSISGSYPTFALSVRFWAQEHLGPRAQDGLRLALDSLALRTIAGPFFYAMDRIALGTVVTVIARPYKSDHLTPARKNTDERS